MRHVVFARSFRDLTEHAHWMPLDFGHTFLSTVAGPDVQERMECELNPHSRLLASKDGDNQRTFRQNSYIGLTVA